VNTTRRDIQPPFRPNDSRAKWLRHRTIFAPKFWPCSSSCTATYNNSKEAMNSNGLRAQPQRDKAL
jgi:hypothetical protein